MKKTIVAMLAFIFVSVSGISYAADKVFALVPKAMNNPFFDLARDGCKVAEQEIGGIECLYIGPGEHTEQEQVQIVQDLIAKGVDGIAVASSNAAAMAKAVKGTDIPIITWDSDLLNKDAGLRKAYVGTKNYDIGVYLAQIVMMLKPNGGEICIQSGGAAAANHNERMSGIRDTIAGRADGGKYPSAALKGENGWTEASGCPLYTNDDFPLSVQQMEDIFAKHPDLTAFVPTGGFPQFVSKAFRRVAEKHADRIGSMKTAVVIADTLPMQMEDLDAGRTHGQVGQQPYMMGYKAMYVLKDIVDGKPLKFDNTSNNAIYTGLDVCMKPNIGSCIAG